MSERWVGPLAVWMVASAGFVACGDDGGKRKIGASCGSDSECTSGICGGGVCLDPEADTDQDGLINRIESNLSTDPTNADSDGDGKLDAAEVGADLDHPTDQDGDGKIDAIESAERDGDGDCIFDERDPQDDVAEIDLAEVADRQCCCDGRCSALAPPLTPTAVCQAGVLTCTPGTGPGGGAELYPCDGTPPSCDQLDDECNEGRWDEATSRCTAAPIADGTACDDGDACTSGDQCLTGECTGAPLPCDDGVVCSVDSCDPGVGCQHDLTPCECVTDADCDDDDACTGSETCDPESLSCLDGTPVDCASFADQCNSGACDPSDGTCFAEPVTDATVCDDGDACTQADACTGGSCGGTAVDCDDGVECSLDSCDPSEGCSHDLTPCDELSATVVGATQIDLAWTYRGDSATGFEIECDEAGAGFTQVAIVGPEARSYSLTDLSPDTDYLCRVRAVMGDVFADWVTGPLVTTPPAVPEDPTDLSLTVVGATRIDLAWAHGGDNVTGFEIGANEAGAGFEVVGMVGAEERTFAHGDLSPSTDYAYRVTALNGDLRSGSAEAGPVTTPALAMLVGVTLADSQVTVKDALGVERTAMSSGGSESQYSLDVSGMTPPFLLRVDGGTGRDLFSVALGPGVANINPFSDLLIGGWYRLVGLAIEDAFAELGADTPVPSQLEIDMLTSILRDVTLRTLILEGVDTATFDVITTLYPTDGTGLDAVIGLATISADRSAVSIGDADGLRACQQTTLVGWEVATSHVTLETTTSCTPGRASSSTLSGIIPTTQELQDAVAAVDADLAVVKDTVNDKGANLRATDLDPGPGTGVFHADFRHDGADATVFAARMVSFFRGLTMNAFSINRIVAFDAASRLITVEAFAVLSVGGETAQERLVLPFIELAPGDWIFYGNQRYAEGGFDVEMRTEQGSFSTPTRLNLNIDVRAPTGIIAAVEVMESAGSVFPTFTAVPSGGFTDIEQLLPDPPPALPLEVERDVWFTGADLSAGGLPLGTVFTFRLTPTAAGAAAGLTVQTWQSVVAGVSNEAVTITTPTSGALAAANLGGDLDVAWTAMPVSYAITSVDLSAHFFDLDQGLECSSEGSSGVLGPTSTSGRIGMLGLCDGQSIERANVNLSVNGAHGERTHVIFSFE